MSSISNEVSEFDVRDAARCDLPVPSRRGPSGFGIQTQSIFFLLLEEWHDHSRSDRYQKCAGDQLAENAGNGQSGDSRPLNRGRAATSRDASRQNVSQLGKLGKPSVSATSAHVAARYRLKGARCGLGQFSF